MPITLQSVTAEALQLTADERAELIETLIASLAPPSALHPAWEAEVERRLADLDAGRGEAIPADEVFDRQAPRYWPERWGRKPGAQHDLQ